MLDTSKPPHQKLKENIETKLTELLKEYRSQFAQEEIPQTTENPVAPTMYSITTEKMTA